MKRVLGLLSIATLFAACNDAGTNSPPPDVTVVSMANATQFVANTLTVPLDRMQFGLDLNGDGKADNQLGNIIGALSANNLDTQGGVDTALCEGNVLLLVTGTADDATFQASEGAGALVEVGQQFNYVDTSGDGKCGPGDTAPAFDGSDTVTRDTAFAGAQFAGRINNGLYSSNSPVTTTHPVTVQLQLPLVSGAAPVQLKIVGAHIQYRVSGTGASRKLMSGQINGAIKQSDVTGTIIPNVATLLNDRVTANPTGSTEKQILQIFDIGCTGMTNLKGDGQIATCEVADNSIIKNVLNPDVQMFDASGNYHPNSANTNKDSLSLGLGFSGVGVTFQ